LDFSSDNRHIVYNPHPDGWNPKLGQFSDFGAFFLVRVCYNTVIKTGCFMKKKTITQTCLVFAVFLAMSASWSCSIKKFALNQVANALTSSEGGNVFTTDNDPDFIADALPFAIKMYESLLMSMPNHAALRLQTGSLYVMYANAFLQNPAELLPDEQYAQKSHLLKRAKNLYLRGRDMLLSGLEAKYPGFLKALKDKAYDQAKAMAGLADIDHLYWAGAGWLGAFAIDPFDMKLGITLPQAAALMERVRELNPDYGAGSIDDFYVLYYGALPDYMGGSAEKSREHFSKALAASKGRSGGPYLSLATTVLVNEQKKDDFLAMIEHVLAIDAEKEPENRLLNVINRRRALWLKEHVDYFFLDENETELPLGDEGDVK
jgi:predicted anti-sigma-YlaC factor YlaD